MRKLPLAILFPALALSGCQLMQPQGEDPVLVKLNELERRLASIERVVQNQSLAGMTQQVASIERRSARSVRHSLANSVAARVRFCG